MYSINFTCPKSRTDSTGLSKVQIWVTVNGVRKTTYLPIKANPLTFKKQLNSNAINDINLYCNNIKMEVNKYVIFSPTVTIDDLVEFIKNDCKVVAKTYTIEMMMDNYVALLKERTKSEITVATYNKYLATINKFFEVVDKNMSLDMVKNHHIQMYKQHLLNTYHFKTETLAGYLKKLKAIFTWAVLNEHLNKNPFMDMKIQREVKEVIALTEGEVIAIEQLNLTIDRLVKVKDCFLFACYTGLSFSDMATFSKDDIKVEGDVHYIKKKRHKTGVEYIIPLSDKAMYILTKYDFKLPVISNVKTNAYLKEIQDLAGINKNLHFHLARHTALTLMLNNNVPIEVVAKIAGHSNIKQTQHYAKIIEDKVLSYAGNL